MVRKDCLGFLFAWITVWHTSCLHFEGIVIQTVGGRKMSKETSKDTTETSSELKPRMPVRRFDVFAEYNRQKALEQGMPEDEAEGYGLWVAKVVASGGGRSSSALKRASKGAERAKGKPEKREDAPKEKWHSLGGEEQTDEMYQKEIVRRMGDHFYNTVFMPAIEEAVKADKGYQEIRDSIRKDWKP
jgi:hypothetical protein